MGECATWSESFCVMAGCQGAGDAGQCPLEGGPDAGTKPPSHEAPGLRFGSVPMAPAPHPLYTVPFITAPCLTEGDDAGSPPVRLSDLRTSSQAVLALVCFLGPWQLFYKFLSVPFKPRAHCGQNHLSEQDTEVARSHVTCWGKGCKHQCLLVRGDSQLQPRFIHSL